MVDLKCLLLRRSDKRGANRELNPSRMSLHPYYCETGPNQGGQLHSSLVLVGPEPYVLLERNAPSIEHLALVSPACSCYPASCPLPSRRQTHCPNPPSHRSSSQFQLVAVVAVYPPSCDSSSSVGLESGFSSRRRKWTSRRWEKRTHKEKKTVQRLTQTKTKRRRSSCLDDG